MPAIHRALAIPGHKPFVLSGVARPFDAPTTQPAA